MQFKVKGILSFPTLFTPKQYKNKGEYRYSCTVLLSKQDPQYAAIYQLQQEIMSDTYPSGFPADGRVFIHDCAESQPNNPELRDYVEIRFGASEQFKPDVVDSNLQPIVNPGEVFSGELVWVSGNTYGYDGGVTAGLNGVMALGEVGPLGRLDGRPSAQSLFGDLATGSPPAPAPSTI